MRKRLALFAVTVALTAGAAAGTGVASAHAPEPMLTIAGSPVIPGVVYTGSIGNVEF
jgi:hypothetical protein